MEMNPSTLRGTRQIARCFVKCALATIGIGKLCLEVSHHNFGEVDVKLLTLAKPLSLLVKNLLLPVIYMQS